MTVTDVRTDPEARTLILDAAFTASPEAVWDLWADPRKLERWWGPPGYPATVTSHDLSTGGRVEYHIAGDHDIHRCYWDVHDVDPPHHLRVTDGFIDAANSPTGDQHLVHLTTTIEPVEHGTTRMRIEATFDDLDSMERLLAAGMRDGLEAAIGQIDELLTDLAHSTDTR